MNLSILKWMESFSWKDSIAERFLCFPEGTLSRVPVYVGTTGCKIEKFRSSAEKGPECENGIKVVSSIRFFYPLPGGVLCNDRALKKA